MQQPPKYIVKSREELDDGHLVTLEPPPGMVSTNVLWPNEGEPFFSLVRADGVEVRQPCPLLLWQHHSRNERTSWTFIVPPVKKDRDGNECVDREAFAEYISHTLMTILCPTTVKH